MKQKFRFQNSEGDRDKITRNKEQNDGEDNNGETKLKKVSIFQLFRFADKWDIALMVVGLICSCAHGCALPVMLIVFGDMATIFANSSSISGDITDEEKEMMSNDFMASISEKSIYYVIIGCVVLVVCYVQVTTFLIASYRQVFKLRQKLFSAALHQEIGWFDSNDTGELSSRLSEDVNLIQEGLGDKMGILFQWMTTFVVGMIIGFVYSWRLALVVVAFSPLLVVSGAVMTYIITTVTKKELNAYGKAGAIAEEAITAIRTVVAFGGQEKEFDRYDKYLGEASKFGIKKGMFTGGGMGMVFLVKFTSYALAFWYGSKLVVHEEIFIGDMLIVFFCVVVAALVLGYAGPNIQSVGTATGAAYKLWNIVDRKSKIDSSDPGGIKLESVDGYIEFRNIHFHFPSREEIKILRGLNMKISKGQTVAVVGASGCGKSTVIQLLQRFYDPSEGSVLIDGTDIKELNVKWLRQQIGIVSQEPILFATTIEENISYGCDGVTQEQIEAAAKEANAHDFISKLPNKYKTPVGERGAQLSGGQKQRIAIARALVKNPKIILLDEATSALDTESESTVQAALDKAQSGRTTIVVAHRLSTIRNADVIFGIKDGVVHESGTHDELMELGGIYYQLVMNQTMQEPEESTEELTEDEGLTDVPLNKSERLPSTRDRKLSIKGEEFEIENETDYKVEKYVSMLRVFKYNKPEWHIILIGCIAATIQGGIQPSFAIIFASFLGIFRSRVDDENQESEILLYSILFVVIGVVSGISTFLLNTMFAISGERLTKRIRRLVFNNLLRQNISFFDDHNNGVGALTTRLSTDASAVQGASGIRLGLAFQSLAGVGVGIIIGFIHSWQLTLLIMACVPFILASAMLQMKLTKGFSGRNQSALELSGKIVTEVLSNIRTVTALTKEDMFYNQYCDALRRPHKDNVRRAHLYGIAYSISQSLIFFIYATIFVLGAYLIKIGQLDYQSMYTVFGAIVFAAISLGQASQFAPDYAKSKASVNRIFSLIDNVPSIDVYSKEGLKPVSCKGSIQFKSVTFAYPTRKSVKVLKKLNLSVQPGMTVALVGSSGCGKSTTIQLLERFYDALSGNIMLDGNNLKSLNVAWLRAQMGLVSQEPILFDCSIKENIAYGDNSRQVEMNEIIQAARMANIANFIDSLPQGYETGVGDKGTQLSGGQKQRIAIARALVRNPKILLLDEATSALDTESEKVVQEALDRAQEGRTSLVIAHRLSTIQNADCIFVFHNGVVSEFGTHSELMALNGIYYNLVVAQGQKN